jgi:transcriptional regulator NrdR family protein
MARMATTDEFEEYMEGGLCPYCYAEDIVLDSTTWEGKTVKRSMFCNKCDMKWTEMYAMTGLFLDDSD